MRNLRHIIGTEVLLLKTTHPHHAQATTKSDAGKEIIAFPDA